MRVQSAITTLTRTITVAAGVFAPGHLGELTRHVPFELVDAVLTETGAVQRRLRCLPSRVGVYFILALALFPRLGYARVWDKLVAGLDGLAVVMPSEKALRDLRRRIGVAPLRALFDAVTGPLAQPGTPGVRYHRYRTVAFDGCRSIKAPDAARNRSWLGRIHNQQAWAGYPMLMLMALVETGSRGLLGARFGPTSDGEITYARRLLYLLTPDMLLLADRAFDGNGFLQHVTATGARFLIRLDTRRRPPVLAPLPDGSYLTRFADLQVRVIEATIITTTGGLPITGHYRLATTLLDHHQHPAETLLRLYHERWEIESAFYALRHTIFDGHVLRSTDPIGLQQELWALLTVYQTLRMSITDATESRHGTDPDRASFTIALEHARNQIINAAGILPNPAHLLGTIGTALLADLMPTRRARTSIRKVKAPTSRYPGRPKGDDRPTTSTRITSSTYLIHPRLSTPPPRTKPRLVKGLGDKPVSLKQHVVALMTTKPHHHWHIRDVAEHIPFPNHDTCRAQLWNWARQGLIRRVGPGTYSLPNPAQDLTTAANP